MIQSGQITMYLDDLATPLHDPVFGVAHQSPPGTSFEDIVSAGTLSCLTITATDVGSTRTNIDAATTVRFVVSTNSGDVNVNGSVQQITDAFGGGYYSVAFVVS